MPLQLYFKNQQNWFLTTQVKNSNPIYNFRLKESKKTKIIQLLQINSLEKRTLNDKILF